MSVNDEDRKPQSSPFLRDVATNFVANLAATPFLYLGGVALGVLPKSKHLVIVAAILVGFTLVTLGHFLMYFYKLWWYLSVAGCVLAGPTLVWDSYQKRSLIPWFPPGGVSFLGWLCSIAGALGLVSSILAALFSIKFPPSLTEIADFLLSWGDDDDHSVESEPGQPNESETGLAGGIRGLQWIRSPEEIRDEE